MRLGLLLAAIAILSLHRLVVVVRQGFFTLPYGPPVTRDQSPLRYFAGVLILAIVLTTSIAIFLHLQGLTPTGET